MPAVIRRRDIYDEGQVKPRSPRGDVDLALKLGVRAGRAWLMATHLGLEPCWGKLDARHLRGGAGNVAMRAGLRPTAKALVELAWRASVFFWQAKTPRLAGRPAPSGARPCMLTPGPEWRTESGQNRGVASGGAFMAVTTGRVVLDYAARRA